MAVYQQDYSEAPPIGIKGQIANEEKHNQISRTVANPEGIPFSAPGFRVPGQGNDHKIAATGTAFLGLAVLTPAVPAVAPGSTLIDGYPQQFTGAFMTDGTMYVEADGAVAPGDPVFFIASGTRFANAGQVAIPGAFFDTTATARGQIVEISLKHRSA